MKGVLIGAGYFAQFHAEAWRRLEGRLSSRPEEWAECESAAGKPPLLATSNSHFDVAQASSPASSRGVPPRDASDGETSSKLAAGTAAPRCQNENCCLAAVADKAPGKARAFADKFGIPRAYESVEEALAVEKPDFVDITTRPESHLELTRLAAANGAHVICQKPMAPTMADCVAMCDACENAGVRLLIHENWRWQPWYREVKRLLNAGVIGAPFQIAVFWRTGDGRGPAPYPTQPYFKDMPRLLVYETLVHPLDTFRFLFGEIKSVVCQNRRINPVIVGEDASLIQVTFADGRFGLIDANRITGPVPAPVAMSALVVEGDDGTLRMSADGRLWLTKPGQPEQALPFVPPTTGYKGDSVLATQAHLLECLRTGQASESDGRDYLRTIALVEACYTSDRDHAVVHLK